MRKAGSGMTVVAMVCAAFAGGALVQWLDGGAVARAQEAQAGSVIEVQALRLVDADGQERGMLGVREEGVGLILRDAAGRHRVALGSMSLIAPEAEAYWGLEVFDAAGVGRLGWGARDDGQGSGGHVTDANGVVRIGIGAAPEGVGLNLRDEEGRERLGMGLGPGGGGDFMARDPFGNDIWRALGNVGPMP